MGKPPSPTGAQRGAGKDAGHTLEARDGRAGGPGTGTGTAGGRGRRRAARAHRSTPELSARTAGASRAGARSGGRHHRAVGGRRRGRRGGSLARPKIFGRGDRLGGIILKVGLLGKLLGSVFQLQRRGQRAGMLGRSAGRAARGRRRGRRFVPGRQFRRRVFRGLIGKIDPLVFRGGSSRFGGRHGAKNAVQVIDGREFVPFGLCCCLVPSCGQRRFILHRALSEGSATLYGLYFYGRGPENTFSYLYLYNSWARTFRPQPCATWNESRGIQRLEEGACTTSQESQIPPNLQPLLSSKPHHVLISSSELSADTKGVHSALWHAPLSLNIYL